MDSSGSANTAKESSELNPTELIEQHQQGLWRYLRALGCDESLADDLVQETFLKVLQRPFTHYNTPTTAAFLRRVARNLFISLQRRAGRVIAVDDLQKFEAIWCQWVKDPRGDDYLDALKGCFETLAPRAKWALEMRFRDRMPRTDIAKNLKITENGAKNLMQRAKARLRDCIERKIDNG